MGNFLCFGKAVESAKKPTAEKQQTTNGSQAEMGKPGECAQPDISYQQHGQLATPLDGPGRRVSGGEPSQDLSANVLNGLMDSCSIRGI